MNWLGLDIGGANLKAADGRGWARSVPFPLWRQPQQLSEALRQLIRVEAVRRVAQSLEDHSSLHLTVHASIVARSCYYGIRRKYRFQPDHFLLRS